jgi:predicted RNase H-like nuclease (RuvC/YqgF family)
MEAAKPITPSETKRNEFPISIGSDQCIFSIIFSGETIQFIIKKENDTSFKFEKSLSMEQLNKISKWFKIFDSLDEVFDDIIKLMEKKQINVNMEQNSVNLKFNINMEKIKEFDILLEQKELSKDEIINNLIKDNKELKTKVEHLEKKMNDYEKRLNIIEEKLSNKKENMQNISNKGNNDIFDSNIINEEDKVTLNNWINLNNDKKIKLLYKASRDGDNYQDFYRLCENKGPTLTVALTTKGYKFVDLLIFLGKTLIMKKAKNSS